VRETEFTPNFKGILGSNRWSNAYSGFNPLEELCLLFADIEHSFACSHCICKKNQVFGAGGVFANFGGALALKLWIRIILPVLQQGHWSAS